MVSVEKNMYHSSCFDASHKSKPSSIPQGCFFFVAIIFTKQCWYCSQKLHGYAVSFLHMASYYTKLNMCIWLWCVAKDCPWLSNSTLRVILILLHSMTEYVLEPHWWGCTASALLWSWGSMIQSVYLIVSIMEINARARERERGMERERENNIYIYIYICVRACVCVCVCVCVWFFSLSLSLSL